MKNAFTLICAALLSVISFVSCDFTAEDFIAPQDTWVNKDFKYAYKDSNGTEKTVTLTGYFLYSDDKYTNSSFKSGVEIPAGLTVVIISRNNDALGLSAKTYVKKTFAKGKVTEADPDDIATSAEFDVGPAFWTAFYLGNSISFAKNGNNVPEQLRYDSYTELSADGLKEFTSKFSWRKLLANILLAE